MIFFPTFQLLTIEDVGASLTKAIRLPKQPEMGKFAHGIIQSRRVGKQSRLPILLTSMWNQQLYFWQISAISSKGSKAPNTVVPAVALTKNGICPRALRSRIKRSSSLGIILPCSSDGTMTQFSVPKPQTEAQDLME